MKIIVPDFKKGVKIAVENPEDLWYLSHIIDSGDLISGKTERKIKLETSSDRDSKVIKKHIFLRIEAEKIEFHKYSDSLRVSGKVISENEDVPKGSYHTFDISDGSVITIEKNEWAKFQKDKLIEASKSKQSSIMIIVLDRDDATFALLKKYGYEKLLELEGDVEKKALQENKESKFYEEIIKKIQEYDKRFSLERIIIASPAFWKEDLVKKIKDDALKKKIITATCSSSKNAIEEVIKRPELGAVLKEEKASQESKLIEELLSEISKEGKATYGFKNVRDCVNSGNVEILLVSDGFIFKSRELGKYAEIDSLMKDIDRKQGQIKIISSENDAGKKLDGLSGIGAILRYKVSY
jgi:protein pelota